MNVVQITPGAGRLYCGNCFRDNALVAALRRQGHQVLMVPLYLPVSVDEPDQSAGTPVFFGGVSVYLEQHLPWFRQAPAWFRRWLAAPWILKWAAGRAAKTQATDLGDLTLSMVRGEEGNQLAELETLIGWLKTQPRPDVICLSNALLIGLARRLRRDLGAPVVCLLQGETGFLDSLPTAQRQAVWETLTERAAEVDLFVASSQHHAGELGGRLRLSPKRVRVVHNGISLEGFSPAPQPPAPPVLGFFARMCREKGLDTLVEAFRRLRKRPSMAGVRLRVGGACSPADQPLVDQLRIRLEADGLLGDVEFCPNLDRAAKLEFLRSLSVLSVPALPAEAFGLYVIEALAAGVPVVQPNHAAFPELVSLTGGGLLYDAGNVESLVDALATLLANPEQARSLGLKGRQAVLDRFSIDAMASEMVRAWATLKA